MSTLLVLLLLNLLLELLKLRLGHFVHLVEHLLHGNHLRNKLGKYNEEEMAKLEEERKKQEEEDAKKLDQATIGSRCKVLTKGHPTRLGTVMYKGEIEGKPGVFIGVKFDEPLGVNDGTANGKRYFECPPKYGSFVAAKAVEIGDFPPEKDELDDEL